MSAPLVPPRPTRANVGPTAVPDAVPQVPPRPLRKLDPSPAREESTRSPLNDLPNPMSAPVKRRVPTALPAPEQSQRPPTVSMPSIGQEGLEYASYDELPPEAHGVKMASPAVLAAPEQTRNVSASLPMHAPKASVPQSTAKSRIETVTSTDSTQAAAVGIGKAKPDDDVHKTPADSITSLHRVVSKPDDHLRRVPSTEPHPLRQMASFSRSTSSLPHGSSRPESMHEGLHEHGIPEIGMQIPLNPNAGDVQAPSPAPTQSQHAPGIGFFNDGSARAHHRKRSSRHEFNPPGSYGLHGHGHGHEPQDALERQWHMKHPDALATEGYNVYGNLNTPRPEYALSSDQLNRIVSHTSDIGMGTEATMVGTPTQEIAFTATQEYTSRMSSPKPTPSPLTERSKRPSSGTIQAAESPLRKASFPFLEGSRGHLDDAVESEDDDGVIHVDEQERIQSKITGGGAADDTLDLGPRGGNSQEEGGWYVERGEGTPILASDELLKRPSSAFMHPAVNPEMDRNGDEYDSDHGHHETSRRGSLRAPSRPSSRPNSMHGEYQGGNLHRFMSHEEHHASGMGTPLEEIEEYEPLFPEGEEDEQKPLPPAIKKRPGLEHHHFPSQDIWEDTPSSLQYQTTVETPEPPPEMKAVAPPPAASSVFETPEQEQKRRVLNPDDMSSDSKTFAKPHFKPGVHEEIHARPGVQRFPSQDVWEDTPDSMRLITTVNAPQMDETKSPPDVRPTTSAIPGSQDDAFARATTGFSPVMRPSVPSRPHRRSKLAEEIRPDLPPEKSDERGAQVPDLGQQILLKSKSPPIPERPKPSVPARPARPARAEQADAAGAPLSKTVSAESEGAAEMPTPKAKPAVPARPGGEKIAALKAGFMTDLNNRLKLGPQGPPPKPKEEEVEETPKAPLADARKSRAKGPARRKPDISPSTAAEEEQKPAKGFSFHTISTLWEIDEKDELNVPEHSAAAAAAPAPVATDLPALEKVLSENAARNTAEPTLAEPMSPEKAKVAPVTAVAAAAPTPADAVGADGDVPEPSTTVTAAEERKGVQPELEAALVEATPAPVALESNKMEVAAADDGTERVGEEHAGAVAVAPVDEEGTTS